MRTPKPENVAVGGAIRRFRTTRGYSVSYLAQLADVSQPYLSQLEKGAASPSVATLFALAAALSVEPGELLTPTPHQPPSDRDEWLRTLGAIVTKPAERQSIQVGDHGDQSADVLTPEGARARLTAYKHTFAPGDPQRPWHEHPGEDFIYVLSGSITLELRGQSPVTLHAGESVHHSGLIPHRCALVGTEPAQTILVSARTHTD